MLARPGALALDERCLGVIWQREARHLGAERIARGHGDEGLTALLDDETR